MNFETIMTGLRDGESARRAAWSGRKFVRLMLPSPHSDMTLPYLYMTTDDGHRCPWVAKQRDLIEDDWEWTRDVDLAGRTL
jgi:hypothetical protein